ncbi:pyridoxamine 5'-phosphate oxidase family protein [Bacteroidales bacterium]|nr:pyridoxamine 5'-phosphate oxidase family protein [Bacteroidales bacterium]
MITIPELVKKEWDNKQDAIVLTTVSGTGVPNSIYVTQVALYGDGKVLVANNQFNKTLANIEACKEVTVLFITKDTKAFQLKGTISYKTEGNEFDDMKKWNRADLPGHGVAIIEVSEVYSGADKLAS